MRARPTQRARTLNNLGEHMANSVIAGKHDEARDKASEYKRIAEALRREAQAKKGKGAQRP